MVHLVFTLALEPVSALLDRVGSRGLNGDAGGLAVIMLWGIVSVAFVLGNAALLLHELASPQEGRHPGHALLACVLPLAVRAVMMN